MSKLGFPLSETPVCANNSVAMAQATFFTTLGNKLHNITKIFEELDPIKSQGVLCQL